MQPVILHSSIKYKKGNAEKIKKRNAQTRAGGTGNSRIALDARFSQSRTNFQWFHERGRHLAQTTVHTRLNRLVDKGIVRRSAEHPATYETAISREQVSGRYCELFEMFCGQNLVPLMAHLAEKREFPFNLLDKFLKS